MHACGSRHAVALLISCGSVQRLAQPSLQASTSPGFPEATEDNRLLFPDGRALRLSPSSVSTFRQCQLLFLLRHIDRLPEPSTPELAAGNLVHETLHALYQLPPEQRTLGTSQHLFRERWRRQRRSHRYSPLFNLPSIDQEVESTQRDHRDVARERAWGLRAFESLRSYFSIEDPQQLEPLGCEERVAAELSPRKEGDAPIPVTGVIDRIDEAADSKGELAVIDYKTGRSPHPRFRDGAFFQLEMYALLLKKTGRWGGGANSATLRLLFLGDAQVLQKKVTAQELEETGETLRDIWANMLEAFRGGREGFLPTQSPLCAYCAHKSRCPAFAGEQTVEATRPAETHVTNASVNLRRLS